MKTLHYTWRWDIQAPPTDVWPLVCNTHAFNRAVGVGPWTFSETPNALGGSIRVGFLRSWGRLITWDETPFHWVENREFSVLRVYHSGPFLNVLTRLDLEPANSGTTLTYTIDAVPRSRLWGLFACYYIGVHTRRQLRKVFGHVARYLVGGVKEAYPPPLAYPGAPWPGFAT